MTQQTVADVLLALGAALIVATFVLACSTSLRPTLFLRHLERRFPRTSMGFALVILCAVGVAGIAGGLSVLIRT